MKASTHPKYRPDIDGLRAFAVTSVVAYHGFPHFIRGGFVGVDIFFVISGFLISTIIFSNLTRDSFSFRDFYGRRIRRIFPALVLVLVAVLGFGWLALRPDEYQQLGKHAAAGAGFISNLVSLSESGYFDAEASTKPLLHLWSLGVEEQFYIVWPALLWIGRRRRWYFLALASAVAACSFGWNIATFQGHAATAFYSPQTRFWELMVGSILAYISAARGQRPLIGTRAGEELASALGLILIAAPLGLVTKDSPFPGWWALLPTGGAALIIAGGPRSWVNRVIFSNRPMVWLGLISYPIYLWHWPLFSFAYILCGGVPGHGVRLAIVLASVCLAWLTYRFLEQPLARGGHFNRKTLALAVAMIVVGLAGFCTFEEGGFPGRIPSESKRQYPEPVDRLQSKHFSDSTKPSFIRTDDFFDFSGRHFDQAQIAVIGDSHANRLYLGLAPDTRLAVANMGRGSCPPFLGVSIIGRDYFAHPCEPGDDEYLRYVKNDPRIGTIVIGARFVEYENATMERGGRKVSFSRAMGDTLDFLGASGKTIVVALDVPDLSAACYKHEFPVWRARPSDARACTISAQGYLAQTRDVREAVAGRNVGVFDPTSLFCKNGRCGEIDDRSYLYVFDGNHLNALGTRRVGQALAAYLDRLRQPGTVAAHTAPIGAQHTRTLIGAG